MKKRNKIYFNLFRLAFRLLLELLFHSDWTPPFD